MMCPGGRTCGVLGGPSNAAICALPVRVMPPPAGLRVNVKGVSNTTALSVTGMSTLIVCPALEYGRSGMVAMPPPLGGALLLQLLPLDHRPSASGSQLPLTWARATTADPPKTVAATAERRMVFRRNFFTGKQRTDRTSARGQALMAQRVAKQ